MPAKRSPRPKAPASFRKVTMTLPADLAKRLNLLAVQRDTTIGQLAAPALKTMLAGSHFVDLVAQPLAIADVQEPGVQQVELEGERKAS